MIRPGVCPNAGGPDGVVKPSVSGRRTLDAVANRLQRFADDATASRVNFGS
jgi:hypothetical protein